MPARRLSRSLNGVAALLTATCLAACGAEAVTETTPARVDPSKAEAVLRSYLDDNRCDLLSDELAEAIAPDAEAGRQLCDRGQLPVDALVRPGEYTITSAEVIDGDGLITIKLTDGGTRDYVLTPGGSDGFQIKSVTPHSVAKIGEPLRLQARRVASEKPVDAVITVLKLQRIPNSKLSEDEYVSNLNDYYRAKVRITSLVDRPTDIGSLGFTLAQKNGVEVAQPVAPFTDIGLLLPTRVPPNGTISGYLFFSVPSVKQARPSQVFYTMGTGMTGARLVWERSK